MLSDAELGGDKFPQDLLDAIDIYAAYTADPEMELKAAIARADVVTRTRKIIAQAKLANRIQKQAAEICHNKEDELLANSAMPNQRSAHSIARELGDAILAMEIENE